MINELVISRHVFYFEKYRVWSQLMHRFSRSVLSIFRFLGHLDDERLFNIETRKVCKNISQKAEIRYAVSLTLLNLTN